MMLGNQEFKALVDIGNSTTEAIAISEELHKKIGGKFRLIEFEETKPAKKEQACRNWEFHNPSN